MINDQLLINKKTRSSTAVFTVEKIKVVTGQRIVVENCGRRVYGQPGSRQKMR